MGSVHHRLRRRAIVVLAALLLALAVAPMSASASLSGPAQRAPSSLVYLTTAGLATEASTPRSVPQRRCARAVDPAAAGLSARPLRCCDATPSLPDACDGRYTYLMFCALLC
jgi:hypothetical protein